MSTGVVRIPLHTTFMHQAYEADSHTAEDGRRRRPKLSKQSPRANKDGREGRLSSIDTSVDERLQSDRKRWEEGEGGTGGGGMGTQTHIDRGEDMAGCWRVSGYTIDRPAMVEYYVTKNNVAVRGLEGGGAEGRQHEGQGAAGECKMSSSNGERKADRSHVGNRQAKKQCYVCRETFSTPAHSAVFLSSCGSYVRLCN
jgi:hypothetical protein